MHRTKIGAIGVLFLSGTLFCANVLPSQGTPRQETQLSDWAHKAVAGQDDETLQAVRALREAGPKGLYALEAVKLNAALQPVSLQKGDEAFKQRWALAMEQVGAQRDNWASRLYWYTDLEKAKAAAREQKKPILSLRLLGNLDEELSCANSRFFRTALYPHEQISKILRNDFILHWQSVRPVPKVTIDFGDGRKIETTITGNSIHYALDSQGRILDALPGLYGPASFIRWLQDTQTREQDIRNLDDKSRRAYLNSAHEQALQRITREWQADIARVSTPLPTRPTIQQTAASVRPLAETPTPGPDEILIPVPTARNAAQLAMTKKLVEDPLLRGLIVAVPRDRAALERKTDDALWEKIALQHLADAKLDINGLQVLASKTSRAQKIFMNFEASIALDTVRNEYQRHGIIHRWLIDNPDRQLDQFNARVYAELFQTPDSDPWLGLLPKEAYTGIINDGITTSRP